MLNSKSGRTGSLLEENLKSPLSEVTNALPEVLVRAEALDCSERSAAIVNGIEEMGTEPLLLDYFKDEEEAVVIAACNWMSRHWMEMATKRLARVSHPVVKAGQALA